MRNHLFSVFALLAILGLMPACADAAEPAGQGVAEKIPIGINLSQVVDYSTEIPFVDAMKCARHWVSQDVNIPGGWDKGPELELDEQGWIKKFKPGQYADTLMFDNIDGHYPTGRYICLYEGEGAIDLMRDAKIYSREPGRIEFDVTKPSKLGIQLRIRKTDPDNYIRNVRIILPGYEKTYESQVFREPFLNRYTKFAFIRFMDWQGTNGGGDVEWSDRRTTRHYTQARSVALEHMIALCNEMKVDAWFCMPHTANDDYVKQFAQMVKRDLDPALKVYVEYSNEVWNRKFTQSKHAMARGKELNLGENDQLARIRYHAKRAGEVAKIWTDVFDNDKTRLVRVLGSQAANTWLTEKLLEDEAAVKYTDAVAIAPYFGGQLGTHKNRAATAQMTLDEVLQACREDLQQVGRHVRGHHERAAKHGLRVIAYEGGQHLTAPNAGEIQGKLDELFYGANRDDRIADIYFDYLETWRKAGGHEFAVFSSMTRPNKYGSWGILEHENQNPQDVPKYRGVMRFIEQQ